MTVVPSSVLGWAVRTFAYYASWTSTRSRPTLSSLSPSNHVHVDLRGLLNQSGHERPAQELLPCRTERLSHDHLRDVLPVGGGQHVLDGILRLDDVELASRSRIRRPTDAGWPLELTIENRGTMRHDLVAEEIDSHADVEAGDATTSTTRRTGARKVSGASASSKHPYVHPDPHRGGPFSGSSTPCRSR